MDLVSPRFSTIPKIDWEAPDFAGLNFLPLIADDKIDYRLFHLTEISEGKAGAYRLAMANVLSCLNDNSCAGVYVLSGGPNGVELYVGVASSVPETDTPEAAKTFEAAFKGNFLGSKLALIKETGVEKIKQMLSESRHIGLITGVPSFNEQDVNLDDEGFQSIERLVNGLMDDTWQMIIVAEPGTDTQIRDTLEHIYDLSTELSAHMKHSVQQSENKGWQNTKTTGESESTSVGDSKTETNGKSIGVSRTDGSSTNKGTTTNKGTSTSKGTTDSKSESVAKGTNQSKTTGTNSSSSQANSSGESIAFTRERIDKRIEEMQKHLSETLIERFLQGRSKGMFQTAIYVAAEKNAVFNRLSHGVLSIFQGNQSTVTPLRIHKLQSEGKFNLPNLLQIRQIQGDMIPTSTLLAHSTPFDAPGILAGATWLNTRELSLIMGLPSRELPGLKIRKSVDFGLNTGEMSDNNYCLKLGKIIQHGRILEHKSVDLPRSELNKHIFVTGVTGAGKTTTCMKLLLESDLPFLVIEPAKTEYRALYDQGVEIDYYTLGREDLTPFRLNPFELISRHQNLASHISTLNATLAAVFPMEAAMPYIVEEAIINAYKTKGWDIYTGENFLSDNPWSPGNTAWPTFADMITELDAVITSKGMGKEFEDKYKGSLVARLTNLTLGTKGRMLNTKHSLDFSQLLDRRVVIELEEIKDEQDKALFMGLILGRLAECMKQRHHETPGFQHVTLVEEAHRLLSRTEPGESGSKKMGVEMFANMLAEVRKYGEGLIIADQIPNKLVPDVIKNTNTKIVHRLFAKDDRNTIGDSMGLSDEQKDFLPMLQPGETIIYSGGWHAPVWVKIDKDINTDNPDIPETEFKRKGCQHLWSQRYKLLPNLASCMEIDSPEVLAGFVYDGGLMLNMLLKINQGCAIGNNKDIPKRKIIRLHLVKKMDEWCQKLETAESRLNHLLTKLLLDCASLPGFTTDDLNVVSEVFPLAIEKLYLSVEEFDTFMQDDRKSATVFKNLQKFDSI
jgi:hypothetical protein